MRSNVPTIFTHGLPEASVRQSEVIPTIFVIDQADNRRLSIVLNVRTTRNHVFTVLFTIPRLAGWLAHWKEWVVDPENRIYRPFQVYKGTKIFFVS